MKLIKVKCPSCKEIITVDGDSDSTKCEECGDKISIKDAIVEMMMSKADEVEEPEELEIEEEQPEEEQPEIEESIEEEVEEKPKKKSSKSKKSIGAQKYILQGDSCFDGKDYDKAYDCYVEALNVTEDDSYAEYRLSLINLFHNMSNKNKLMSAYDKLLEVDYYLDDNGKTINDTTKLKLEFFEFLFEHCKDKYDELVSVNNNDINYIKRIFNLWYLYLYLFENVVQEEDLDQKIYKKVLLYIVDLIYYLQSVYRYHDETGNFGAVDRDFQDTNNYDNLEQKRNKYSKLLLDIDPSCQRLIKKPVEKKTKSSLNRSYMAGVGIVKESFKEGFSYLLWGIIGLIVTIIISSILGK